MSRFLIAVSALAMLSACGDGQPFFDEQGVEETDGEDGEADSPDTADEDTVDEDGGVENATGDLPPGTSEPSGDRRIVRYEPDGSLIDPVVYNSEDDTIIVNNIPFDGANVYQRGDAVSTLGGYAVYDADVEVPDFLTGEPIDQITPYRALVGMSRNTVDRDGEEVPRTAFAIVRTGGYVEYGFGGFVYSREGGVTLPDDDGEEVFAGQARFTGDYAGMRVFSNRGGLEYTRGEMRLDLDFSDFDGVGAVKGSVTDRRAFDVDGNRLATGPGEDDLKLPNLIIDVQEGFDSNGEVSGGIRSYLTTDTDTLEEYEAGNFYAILAGDTTDADDGGEIVGVLVVESTDPRYDTQVQETGGFILYR
ncbi:hypothetical protein [Histidinibacterium aquaticum]|uniref:Uncharacterized protein n=1 Tax=Histidinibacterium aquaticum TaxID=2613962 RepID=A0A5J5GP74_9RHOB|nr:hypothetical protein [Histidinibacterium aquaticum]KAA9009855.1 hypothetical protein F3S47_00865 [Histidinibacterium aquaticum]